MSFDQLVGLCRHTHEEIQRRAARAVDVSLKAAGIGGTGPTNLKVARQFYVQLGPIGQIRSDQFPEQRTVGLPVPAIASLSGRFTCGWSHYVELLTIDLADERRFYEIEATAKGASWE